MRIRTIKPEFFKNDQLAELDPIVRLLFIGLWCLADCKGRLEDRPKRIRAEIFPYDGACDVDALLTVLHDAGYVQRYCVNDAKFIQVPGFNKHQRITGSEADNTSLFPEVPDYHIETQDAPEETPGKQSGNTLETPRTTGREGKGMERGKEGNKEAAALSVLDSAKPETSTPKPSESKARGTLADLQNFAVNDLGTCPEDGEFMFNHWESNGWRNGSNPVKDWRAGMRKYKSQGWLPSQKGKSPRQLSTKPTPPPL